MHELMEHEVWNDGEVGAIDGVHANDKTVFRFQANRKGVGEFTRQQQVGIEPDLARMPDNFRVLATPLAVVWGITYGFLPFTALPLYVSLERIDKRLVEAAKDLYATKFEAFRKVVLPLSFPGVFAAVILTFVPATGDYVNSSVLGSPDTIMIGQVIQTKFLSESNYPDAAAMSVILMLGMLVLALIYAKVLGTEDETLAAGAAGG